MRGSLAEIACKRVISVNLPLIRPCGATFPQRGRLESCIKSPLTIMPAAQRVEKPPSAREVPRRGGGREPCQSPKYFGQPYSSLPHRLRAEPPRRGGQGVSTPFSTVCGSPAWGGGVSGFPHFHSGKMSKTCAKCGESPPRRDFLRFVQSCFTRCSFFGSML